MFSCCEKQIEELKEELKEIRQILNRVDVRTISMRFSMTKLNKESTATLDRLKEITFLPEETDQGNNLRYGSENGRN